MTCCYLFSHVRFRLHQKHISTGCRAARLFLEILIRKWLKHHVRFRLLPKHIFTGCQAAHVFFRRFLFQEMCLSIAEKHELFFLFSSFVSAACHVAHQQGTQQNNWKNLQSAELHGASHSMLVFGPKSKWYVLFEYVCCLSLRNCILGSSLVF